MSVTTKKVAKKVAEKKASKAPEKKSPKKAATPEKKTRAKKEGLRVPQLRILAFLAKQKVACNRATIGPGANVDIPYCNSYIGSSDTETRKKNDVNVCMSLLSLGFVREASEKELPEEGRGVHYIITAVGRKASEKASKASKASK